VRRVCCRSSRIVSRGEVTDGETSRIVSRGEVTDGETSRIVSRSGARETIGAVEHLIGRRETIHDERSSV